MISGHFFERVVHEGDTDPAPPPSEDGLVARLTSHVANRFGRATNLCTIVVPPHCMSICETDDRPCTPTHPACAALADAPYCRESWLLHLAELANHPETHWHRCDHGRLCAVVPVVCEGRCLAAVKLVCPETLSEDEFRRYVELLDLVVWDFERAHPDLLRQLLPAIRTDSPAAPGIPTAAPSDAPQPRNPHVHAAIRRIDERLGDPELSVDSIALALAVHPNYLGHVFVQQLGVRPSRYIASQRVERAKELLLGPTGQIKQIARAVGFANQNWFCHVFTAHTGQSPSAYRASQPTMENPGHAETAIDPPARTI